MSATPRWTASPLVATVSRLRWCSDGGGGQETTFGARRSVRYMCTYMGALRMRGVDRRSALGINGCTRETYSYPTRDDAFWLLRFMRREADTLAAHTRVLGEDYVLSYDKVRRVWSAAS